MGADHEIAGIPDNLILFDGVCNLCNSSVNFVIERDRKAVFSFASLQSEAGQALLRSQGITEAKLESVMLWGNSVLYKKSRAALEISRQLSGLWPILYVFRIVPAFLRDFVYDFVAANRYKWFGKRDQCRMPEPGLKKRFVENIPA
ncbi:thiol-disulfide oxidoreductase DCC family protein [uncultured Imperialibacter sp.]|uniref:thiol-disulfide oxidoreductase DCC family protein n=1 Tax=uncultured Imperialibacter sp. TaxID=1672639 RepID=UPI0030D82CBC|tara:strand:- start:940 stop:1377 length:438 start_codon:yes stop_codon:yes gene_type:complete